MDDIQDEQFASLLQMELDFLPSLETQLGVDFIESCFVECATLLREQYRQNNLPVPQFAVLRLLYEAVLYVARPYVKTFYVNNVLTKQLVATYVPFDDVNPDDVWYIIKSIGINELLSQLCARRATYCWSGPFEKAKCWSEVMEST